MNNINLFNIIDNNLKNIKLNYNNIPNLNNY